MNLNNEYLKACPFCGGKPEMIVEFNKKLNYPYAFPNYKIYCTKCFAKIENSSNKEELIKKWNERTQNE